MKRFGAVIFVLLVVYFVFLIRQDIIDYRSLQEEIKESRGKIAVEKARAEIMEQRLADLQSGGLIEEIARTKLGLVKKGETAYKVLDK